MVHCYIGPSVAYELTCPSCGNVVASPFVRVGAVVACARCSAKYRIAENHVKRKVGALAASQAAPPNGGRPAGDDLEFQSTDDLIGEAGDGHVIGLSGLSEMMRQETAGKHEAKPAKPAPPIPAGRPPAHRAPAPSARRRRTDRMVYAIIGGLVLAIGVVGGLLWYMMQTGDRSPFSAMFSGNDAPPAVGDGPAPLIPGTEESALTYDWIPLAEPKPIAEPVWERRDEPFRAGITDHSVWLINEARVFTENAQEHFTATLVCDGDGVIASAVVHLSMVSEEGRTLAQTRVPVTLLGPSMPQPLRVPLPRDLPEGYHDVESSIEVLERIPGGVFFTQGAVEPIQAAKDTYLVSAVNLNDTAVERVVAVLTGVDTRGRAVAQWRVDSAQAVEPRGSVQFRAKLVPPEPVAQWKVEAAGR